MAIVRTNGAERSIQFLQRQKSPKTESNFFEPT